MLFSASSRISRLYLLTFLIFVSTLGASSSARATCQSILLERKTGFAHYEIPSCREIRLPQTEPLNIPPEPALSIGLTDFILQKARDHGVADDFKPLSDAVHKRLSGEASQELSDDNVYLGHYIERAYSFEGETEVAKGLADPQWKISSGKTLFDKAFDYVEQTWTHLVRKIKPKDGGSLLATPYPFLIPAGRFQEAYYWDTYFGVKGLLATKRLELAQMQAENLLSLVRRFGMVPNGTRDYYLSRSQPPMLSSVVRDVYDASVDHPHRLQWLIQRAYPLVKVEYEDFWMNPETRFDRKTGLNHHWDALNEPRPERHGKDREEELGRTYRDVRAAAEAGEDFTDTLGGEASNVASILLNSMLYKTEVDLAWMAEQAGDIKNAKRYRSAAERRQKKMTRYLWNAAKGRFENYNLRTKRRIDVLGADTFAPLFVGAATDAQAKAVRSQLVFLERQGGLMSSTLTHSPHQWDGMNGWAPQHMMAVAGLKHYGYRDDAQRIARKWVETVALAYEKTGLMYERMDVEKRMPPKNDNHKYPVQAGFLWTNSSYAWFLTQDFGVNLEPLP